MPDAILDGLSVEKRREGWHKQLEELEEGVHYLVAEAHGMVVGWCIGGVSRDEDATKDIGELYGIYVDPDFIGQGAGSSLMARMLQLLHTDGYAKVTLWVLDTNEKTRKFYEKKGWHVEGKTKVDTRDDFELHETRYIISF
jgi:L-amino acid N-acyltransferase YncA